VSAHSDDCEFPPDHDRGHPCGRPSEQPGEQCRFCGLTLPKGGPCDDCWTPIPANTADAKALLARGGFSMDVAP
jgi:hypothetical protein